jgi:hypothetical protein
MLNIEYNGPLSKTLSQLIQKSCGLVIGRIFILSEATDVIWPRVKGDILKI